MVVLTKVSGPTEEPSLTNLMNDWEIADCVWFCSRTTMTRSGRSRCGRCSCSRVASAARGAPRSAAGWVVRAASAAAAAAPPAGVAPHHLHPPRGLHPRARAVRSSTPPCAASQHARSSNSCWQVSLPWCPARPRQRASWSPVSSPPPPPPHTHCPPGRGVGVRQRVYHEIRTVNILTQ